MMWDHYPRFETRFEEELTQEELDKVIEIFYADQELTAADGSKWRMIGIMPCALVSDPDKKLRVTIDMVKVGVGKPLLPDKCYNSKHERNISNKGLYSGDSN